MNTDTKEDLRRGFISNSADLAVSADLVLSVSADLAVSATRVTAGLDTRPVTVCGAALATQRTPIVDPSVVFTHRVGAGTVVTIAAHVRLDTVLRATHLVGTGSPW